MTVKQLKQLLASPRNGELRVLVQCMECSGQNAQAIESVDYVNELNAVVITTKRP
jgi:hypothetical protein